MPRCTVTAQREAEEAFWPGSTPLTAKRWSALISTQVNLSLSSFLHKTSGFTLCCLILISEVEMRIQFQMFSHQTPALTVWVWFETFPQMMFLCMLWSIRWPVFGRVDRSDRYRREPHCLHVVRRGSSNLHLLGHKPTRPAHSGHQLCLLLWRSMWGGVSACTHCIQSFCVRPVWGACVLPRLCFCLLMICCASSFMWGLQNQTCFCPPQSHGWRVGNCTQRLPFMCQKKGEVKESATQARCRFEDVSIV